MTSESLSFAPSHGVVRAAIRLVLPVLFTLAMSVTSVAQEVKLPALHFAPANSPAETTNQSELIVEAKLTEKGGSIEKGLVWRIFGTSVKEGERLPVIATAKGGSSSFQLEPGSYLVNAQFGRVGATKRVTLTRNGLQETFVLQAGGLKLNAIAANQSEIPRSKLRFAIYEQEQDDKGNRKLITRDVTSNRIVRLNEGTYHVVSTYGEINATVRADLRVTAGKVTEAVLQHRAAQVVLKLVSDKGGEAIADTAWSIFSDQGEVMKESKSAFPTMILSEGTYSAVARNQNKSYNRDFKIKAGENLEVEVLAN